MSCMIAAIQGGNPEIFPMPLKAVRALEIGGLQGMAAALGISTAQVTSLAPKVEQFIGAALRPDRSPFYLTTLAPKIEESVDHPWKGAFFAPFGIGDIAGSVSTARSVRQLTTLTVPAQLRVDGKVHAKVSWSVNATQTTAPNKSAVIRSITIGEAGPHKRDDIRRCVALHAPQRVFGEPKAIVAMQCGVAAACLLEAIC